MSKPNYPRTEAIMVLMRKAFNATNVKAGTQHLSDAHDAVEALEKDLMRAMKLVNEAAKP